MIRIVGLLAWFDEDPAWLRDSVGSALRLCDAVMALDGAYEGFPGAVDPVSAPCQYEAIVEAGGTPIMSAVYWPDQMAKRTHLFELGLERGADWFFVFDADDLVVQVPADTRQQLTAAREDVAVHTYGGDRYHRGLFRALPDLRVEDAHYHYVAEKDGRTVHLRGNDQVHQLEPFANLTHLRVAHRKAERTPERLAASDDYRRRISESALEATTPEQWAAIG